MMTEGRGLSIGGIQMSTPTCADDVILLSTSEYELQLMLDMVAEYANNHRYKLNPGKTTLTYYGLQPETELYLGETKLTVTPAFKHLGINRSSDRHEKDVLIEERASVGRRTTYSLMPAGMYGQDGLSPAVFK